MKPSEHYGNVRDRAVLDHIKSEEDYCEPDGVWERGFELGQARGVVEGMQLLHAIINIGQNIQDNYQEVECRGCHYFFCPHSKESR